MNALSIDLESWVHRDNVSGNRKKADNGFIIKSTREIMKMLDKYHSKATFFVIAEVYEWYPELIYEIRNRGFEIGYHTHSHKRITTEKILIEEIIRSKSFLTEFSPIGFRAPRMFLKKSYLKILSNHGFKYDSSIYAPFGLKAQYDDIIEFPVSTYNFVGKPTLIFPKELSYTLFLKEIPFGSGYIFGSIGSKVSIFIKKINAKGIPTSIFIHPWQIMDSPTPKLSNIFNNGITSIPYHINRKKSFENLLKKHKFKTYREVIKDLDLSDKKKGE